MKNYTITVNGNVYDVTVEENGSVTTPVSAPRRAAAPVAAPVALGYRNPEKRLPDSPEQSTLRSQPSCDP